MLISAAGGQAFRFIGMKIEFFSLRGAGLRDKKNSIFWPVATFLQYFFWAKKVFKKMPY